MKRILFNATHAEELRVAIVDGQKLIDLDLESAIRTEKKGNIYKGIITTVAPSLEACFVDYGAEKHGFLPLREICRDYFGKYDNNSEDYSATPIGQIKIDSAIKEGQEMIVQVDKDERGNKGAALTTFVSLAGCFLVFMPNNPKGGGISRRISGNERVQLREALSHLKIAPQHSLIARTEGIGRSADELQRDLDFSLKLWQAIEQSSSGLKAPFLIYQESNLIVRSIRDHLSEDIAEIIIDDEAMYERAKRFINQVMPQNLYKLKLYNDSIPLFSRYQIENQIESAFNREVNLPAGGAIVIDHTEALTSIDVNSARSTKGSDIEETAWQTNLEAVDEIARQLKVRDMGGLIVIDLIDMADNRNQRAVEARLKEALRTDRARVQVGYISRFGLLEMSRQRLRSSISEANYRTCPRCEGMGAIRNVVSSSLNLLRIIEDESLKEDVGAIQVILPLDMATYLLNEKRYELSQLESRLVSKIIIIPSNKLSSPHFQITRMRSEEFNALSGTASYKQKIEIENLEPAFSKPLATKSEPALVKLDEIGYHLPPTREPTKSTAKKDEKTGLLRRLGKVIFGPGDSAEPPPEQTKKPSNQPRRKVPQHTDPQSAQGPSTRGQPARGRGRGRGNQHNRNLRTRTRSLPNDNQNDNSGMPAHPRHQESKQKSRYKPRQKPQQESATSASSAPDLAANDKAIRSQQPQRAQPAQKPQSGTARSNNNHPTSPRRSRHIPAADENIPDDIGNRKS